MNVGDIISNKKVLTKCLQIRQRFRINDLSYVGVAFIIAIVKFCKWNQLVLA
jgi:hypothetical protein